MLTTEDRKQILANFLETVEWIADKEYQIRVWIRAEGPEVNDFDETVNFFFLEAEGIIECYKDFGVSDKQYHALIRFRAAFEAFNEGPRSYLPELFINTPEWTNITEMAKELLKVLNYSKKRKTPFKGFTSFLFSLFKQPTCKK